MEDYSDNILVQFISGDKSEARKGLPGTARLSPKLLRSTQTALSPRTTRNDRLASGHPTIRFFDLLLHHGCAGSFLACTPYKDP